MKGILTVIITMIISLFSVNCDYLNKNDNSPGSPGTGTLQLNFDVLSSKSIKGGDIVPEDQRRPRLFVINGYGPNGSRFDLWYEIPEEDLEAPQHNVAREGLVFGEWEIKVEAMSYTCAENDPQVCGGSLVSIGMGSGTVLVRSGAVTEAEIYVHLFEGFGGMEILVSWQMDAAINPSVYAEFARSGGTPVQIYIDDYECDDGTNICTALISEGGRASGYYTLAIKIYDDTDGSGDPETYIGGSAAVVRIMNQITTEGEMVIVANPDWGYGDIDLTITPIMNEPIEIELTDANEAPILDYLYYGQWSEFTARADVSADPDYPDIDLTWYLNGEERPDLLNETTGVFAISDLGGSLEPGLYELDVTAFSLDGMRGGSVTHYFEIYKDDLVGNWKLLEEDSVEPAKAIDSTRFVNHGVIYGTPQWVEGVGFIFSGDDYINLGHGDTITSIPGNYTIALWAKGMGSGADARVISRGAAGGNRWSWKLTDSSWEILLGSASSSDSLVCNACTIDSAKWHHYAAVIKNNESPSADTVDFYIDGIHQEQVNLALDFITDSAKDLYLGYSEETGVKWSGRLSDVRIYNYAVTDINTLYNESNEILSIDVLPSTKIIREGDSRPYTATMNRRYDVSDITALADWNSSDAQTATVAAGIAMGVSEGTAKITAVYNGVTSNESALIIDNNYDMVLVEGGTFTMGRADDGQNIWTITWPEHRVTLSSFYLGRTELPLMEYDYYCAQTGKALKDDNGYGRDNMPARHLNWFEAIAFCNWLSQQHNYTPCYYTDSSKTEVYTEIHAAGQLSINNDSVDWNASGYRLPTNAEYEFAAIGGLLTEDYIYVGSDAPGEIAWNNGYNWIPHSLKGKKANELGIYGMSSNAYEWIWDWNSDTYYQECDTPQGNISVDPRGPDTAGTTRIVRGCDFMYGFNPYSWSYTIERSFFFSYFPLPQDTQNNLISLRLCRNAPQE